MSTDYWAVKSSEELLEIGKGKRFAICLSGHSTAYRFGIEPDEALSLLTQAQVNGDTLMVRRDDRYVWLKVSGHLEWE